MKLPMGFTASTRRLVYRVGLAGSHSATLQTCETLRRSGRTTLSGDARCKIDDRRYRLTRRDPDQGQTGVRNAIVTVRPARLRAH